MCIYIYVCYNTCTWTCALARFEFLFAMPLIFAAFEMRGRGYEDGYMYIWFLE